MPVLKEGIEKFKVKSLLDIGAGNGLLAIPLSKIVDNYLAIESSASFARELQKEGLKVIEASFPIKVDDIFDMVLISHTISYKKNLFMPFINQAWDLLKPGGVLFIITYRGQEDDWTRLMSELGQDPMDYNRLGYNKMIEYLYSLGEVKTRKVTTTVETINLDDMIEALAFVASNGEPSRKSQFLNKISLISKVLNSRYRTEKGYSFPFQHIFITTIKNR